MNKIEKSDAGIMWEAQNAAMGSGLDEGTQEDSEVFRRARATFPYRGSPLFAEYGQELLSVMTVIYVHNLKSGTHGGT